MPETLKLDLKETLSLLKEENPKADIVFKTEVPAFRSFDISADVDLIEEILRIYGYTNVEPQRPLLPTNTEIEKPYEEKIRNLLTDRGFNEVITFPWLEESIKELFGLDSFWQIVNPLNAEQKHLRTSLVPSLVKVQLFNQNNFNRDIAIFELGKHYLEEEEVPVLGLLAVGQINRHYGQTKEWNFLTFKGVIEVLLQRFGIKAQIFPCKKGYMHPYLCAKLQAEGKTIGYFGKLHPSLAEKLSLKEVPYVGEIYINLLRELSQQPHYRAISKFPPVRRDFAFSFTEEVGKTQQLLKLVKEVFGDLLEEAFIFDVYRGEKLKEGEVSVALRVVLRSLDGSLSDDEVNRLSEEFIKRAAEEGFNLRV